MRLAKDLVQYNQMLRALARREVASMYVGSFLGFIWTFIQPGVMILVFWFVFSVGFKAKPLNNVPFVVWLTAAMAPWFVFSAIVTSASTVILQYAHLIKKTVFPSQILVVVKILSNLVGHGAFVIASDRFDTVQRNAFQFLLFSVHLLPVLSYCSGKRYRLAHIVTECLCARCRSACAGDYPGRILGNPYFLGSNNHA